MKLDDVRKLTAFDFHHTPEDQQRIQEFLRSIGIDPSNLYQELEMTSQYVDTHRDTSFSNARVSLHSHRFFELLYCHAAENVEYLVGSDRYRLQQGDIVFIPPGISHRPILPEHLNAPYIRDVIWLDSDFMSKLQIFLHRTSITEKKVPLLIRTRGSRWEFLSEVFQRGVREAESRAAGWEAAVIGNTLMILTYLSRAYIEHSAGTLKTEKPELLDNVTAYIENHYAEHISVKDLSRVFFVSSSTISHLFKQKMGLSLYHYITQRRLISAKNLISAGIP